MKTALSHLTLAALAAVFALLPPDASAAPGVPALLNFQGKVVVGSTPFQGTGKFKFALVSGDGLTTFWSNDGTSVAGSEPTAVVDVAVVQGI